MNKSDFDFDLPENLIAQFPLAKRSASRLLKLDKHNGEIEDLCFNNIVDQLNSGDLLVLNDTRVIPARLYGKKLSGGKVEVFIERMLSSQVAKVMLKANKSIKLGTEIYFDSQSGIKVTAKQGMFYLVEIMQSHSSLDELLSEYGNIPLPPYIGRATDQSDQDRYQTVYSSKAGAVAAPTAGLHFDDELLKKLAGKNIQICFVTLHVGAGTFQPVKVDKLADHRMHKEWLEVSSDVCEAIRRTKAQGNRVVAVGTTAVRCLETAANNESLVAPFKGDSQIFIYPGYNFKVVDCLITNFHLPESTLIMLVSAMAGRKNILAAYQHAIQKKYRFFSYGDAMLIV